MNYDISQHFSIGIEPGFTQRGAACFPGWVAFVGDTRLLLNYAELPVIASLKIPLFQNKFELTCRGGFGVSRVITAYRHMTNAGTGDPPENFKLDMEAADLKTWDYGLHGGLGFGYKIGDNRMFVETNYYHGLIDVDNLNTSKNRSLQYSLGYLVSL
ncbi:MAG TPA: outer membrane beta-barrel protein [Saprospiraceae bacterium]|nr:outer membrane beta-barrel protein [Saprospiraceae bacterium]